jgi:hypothetical protein
MTGVWVRRCVALAGGCIAGLGLGGFASGVNNAVNWYVHYPDVTSSTAASTVWLPCLFIGVGLGLAIAATIREEASTSSQPAPETAVRAAGKAGPAEKEPGNGVL